MLEAGYGPLFDRARELFEADDRVRAMWLGGSLGRGDADRMSDLDVLLAVDDDSLPAFAGEWRTWLAAVTPTVVARALPFLPGSLYSVTPGRERLDVVVEAVSAVPTSGFRHRLVVFDRDGLDDLVPAAGAGSGPSKERIGALIEEMFRDYGMFPVVVEREDWLLGNEAIHFIRTLLYQLFVEANAPLPPMGVKQWSAKLTDEQRRVLEALPTGGSGRDDVITAHEAVAIAFIDHARSMASSLGVAWPIDLEEATCRYLRGHGLPALEGADT